MDSAERRTEDDAPDPAVGAQTPDDDLFFPRDSDAEPPPRPGSARIHDGRRRSHPTSTREDGIESSSEPHEAFEEIHSAGGRAWRTNRPSWTGSRTNRLATEVGRRRIRRGADVERHAASAAGMIAAAAADRGRPRMLGRPGIGPAQAAHPGHLQRGQEVLVQVIKEGIGTKGPTLSTYISIAGRYLVLMPGLNRIGVSRKIADDEQRRRLREILNELKPPQGPRLHHPHRRPRPQQEGTAARPGLPVAALAGGGPPHPQAQVARPRSTRKAT